MPTFFYWRLANAQSYCYEMKTIQALSWALFAAFVIALVILVQLITLAERWGRWQIWREPIRGTDLFFICGRRWQETHLPL